MIVLPAFQSKSNEILLPSNKKELVQLYDANSMKFNDLFIQNSFLLNMNLMKSLNTKCFLIED
jgi:hypothetical protein